MQPEKHKCGAGCIFNTYKVVFKQIIHFSLSLLFITMKFYFCFLAYGDAPGLCHLGHVHA